MKAEEMSAQKRPVIGISIGDLNGIGIELILHHHFPVGFAGEFLPPGNHLQTSLGLIRDQVEMGVAARMAVLACLAARLEA